MWDDVSFLTRNVPCGNIAKLRTLAELQRARSRVNIGMAGVCRHACQIQYLLYSVYTVMPAARLAVKTF
jgi:hypothetical protein